MSTWFVWLLAAVVLVVAGVVGVVLPRRRRWRQETGAAWSRARAAVATAQISRDAATGDDPEAAQLLARAERMIADGGGSRAADTAAGYARRADRLWRGER